jgi:hypothetical protein
MTRLEKITLGLIGSLVLLAWLICLPFIIQAWS